MMIPDVENCLMKDVLDMSKQCTSVTVRQNGNSICCGQTILTKVHIAGEWIFHRASCNVTPHWQKCSPLQQWCCYAITEYWFVFYSAECSSDWQCFSMGRKTLKNCHFPLVDLDLIVPQSCIFAGLTNKTNKHSNNATPSAAI